MLLLFNVPLVLGVSTADGSCRSAKESTGLVGLDGFDAEVEGGKSSPVPSMFEVPGGTRGRLADKL